MSHSHAADRRTGSRSALRTKILAVVLILIVAILASAAWVGVRALLAKTELESAVPLASLVQAQIVEGEGAAAEVTASDLASRAQAAAGLTSDPVWRSFELIPWLGPNLTAVRELAASVDDIARNAISPLVGVAGAVQMDQLKPVDGALNVQPLVDAQPEVAEARAALTRAGEQIAAIDSEQTIPQVRDAVVQLDGLLVKANNSIGMIDRVVQLVPAMLGASGPRNYIVLFQNPAELRATGGNPGAVALMHTENGRISLAQQASSGDFATAPTPVLDLAPETIALYGDITGRYIQDVTLTPDFAQSGPLAREMWRQQFGLEADGVISLDPVALSYLLRATGPIALPTGDVLTADNAVQLLLSDAYARYEDPADQDAFFAGAASAVFSAVASGSADPQMLIQALAQAGSEHRVLMWSAHPEEQAILADTTLAGGLPVSDDTAQRFGVYLNDATGAKMSMYLESRVDVGQVTCRQDKRPYFGVNVTLTNTAPADAGGTLSDYVTGGGEYGVAPGNVKTLLTVYGAPDMQNLGFARDGALAGYHPTTDAGHPVSSVTVELAPGESTILSFGWLGATAFDGDIVARTTPMVKQFPVGAAALDCESPLWQ